MIDASIIATIVPPILTAAFAYLIARKRNIVSERISKAKIDSEIQTQALTIVRGVMTDMRDELRREIDDLRKDNDKLRKEVDENKTKIDGLQTQLTASDVLVSTLKAEIATLQATVNFYESELTRLRKEK